MPEHVDGLEPEGVADVDEVLDVGVHRQWSDADRRPPCSPLVDEDEVMALAEQARHRLDEVVAAPAGTAGDDHHRAPFADAPNPHCAVPCRHE